jgi:hypothetical protein
VREHAQEPDIFIGRHDPFAGKPAEAVLRELVDRELIRDLIHLYSLRVPQGVSVADLFTFDGAFIQHTDARIAGFEVRGYDALDAFFSALPPGRIVPTIHHITTVITGDVARAFSSIEVRNFSAAGESQTGSGTYRDRLRRVDGRWLFEERVVDFIQWGVIEPGWL